MPAAKYEAIYLELRQAIEAGEYPKELPTEQRLTERFGCSRNTVRRAIERLAEDGYVVEKPADEKEAPQVMEVGTLQERLQELGYYGTIWMWRRGLSTLRNWWWTRNCTR